jgi:hypothetical protein
MLRWLLPLLGGLSVLGATGKEAKVDYLLSTIDHAERTTLSNSTL